MKRRWLRLILIVPAVATGILLLGISLIHTPPAQRFAFEQVRTRLLSKSSIDIQASEFRFNLFRGGITLENLIVRSASEPRLPPIFQANRIYLKFNVLKIMKGFWHLEELQMTAPKIHYFVGLDGKTNLPDTSSSSGRTPDYLITHGEFSDGSFQFEDLRKSAALTLPRWRLLIDGKPATREHKLDFSCTQKSLFKYQAGTIPIEQLKLSGTLQQTAFQVEAAYLSAANSQLSVKGSISSFSSPNFSLQFNPTLDLNAIAQALDLREKIKGTLAGTIQAGGKLESLQIDARIKGTNISAGGYREANFDLRSRAEWNSRRVLIQSMEVDSPLGSLRGNAELSSETGRGANFVEVRIRDFDLSPLWEQLRPPFNLASRSTGNISLRWNGSFSPSRLTGRAHLNLAATRTTPSLNLLPLSGTLDAQMQPGRIWGNLQPFAALGAQISGLFTLRSFQEVDGDFHGDAPDIGVLISQLSRFLGGSDNPLDGMKISGPLRFTAHASGKLTRPTITYSSETPELQAGILKHLSAKTDAGSKARK